MRLVSHDRDSERVKSDAAVPNTYRGIQKTHVDSISLYFYAVLQKLLCLGKNRTKGHFLAEIRSVVAMFLTNTLGHAFKFTCNRGSCCYAKAPHR
jgi:hypothetical protein